MLEFIALSMIEPMEIETNHDNEDVEHLDMSDAPLVDENAFGIWVSWFDAEDVEYSQSADKFPPRIMVFRSAVSDYLEREPLGRGVRAVDFGTAIYVEVCEGDQDADLVKWVRDFRAFLRDGDWETFAVLCHGGRWVARRPDGCLPDRIGNVQVVASFGPSEPFRKAMAAEAKAHDDEETGEAGWGMGLFIDADALEAMDRKLKNAPTALCSGGACFYRVGA